MLTSLFDLPSTWFWKGNRFLSSPEINQQSMYAVSCRSMSGLNPAHLGLTQRDGVYKQRSLLRGFVSLPVSSQRGRYRTTRLQYYGVQEQGIPSPPSFKCNVLRESLSDESQNTQCATGFDRNLEVFNGGLGRNILNF